MSINARVMKRPLVVEEERLNFDSPDAQETERENEETEKALKQEKKHEI